MPGFCRLTAGLAQPSAPSGATHPPFAGRSMYSTKRISGRSLRLRARHPRLGFTLVELVIVIVVIGVLAAVAMPRFLDINTDSYRATVTATGGSFGASAQAVRAHYVANGYSGARANVPGFGDATVDTNAAGYPVDTADASAIGGTAARCVNLWSALLQNPPVADTAASPNSAATYRASASGEVCTFTYLPSTAVARSFSYNASTGRVAFVNP